jgi:hypothetical protein
VLEMWTHVCKTKYTTEEALRLSCHSNNHFLAISMENVTSCVEPMSLQYYNKLDLLKHTWCFCSVETKLVCGNIYLCG